MSNVRDWHPASQNAATRTREDLQRRFETHRRIASWTHGLLGRSPDNFPSYVSGLVMDPAMFDSIRQGFGNNIRAIITSGVFCHNNVEMTRAIYMRTRGIDHSHFRALLRRQLL